ncbi:MAG: hypothetical protein GC165_10170 [Armatimonadetes bacterium]|nr:hypothetical protein [Armatimonadota bacterium]
MKQPGKIAFWIFGMVVLAVVILQAGRYSFTQDNSSKNYGPSGTSAFLELIKQSGYKVTVDRSLTPKADKTLIIPAVDYNRKKLGKFISKLPSGSRVVVIDLPLPDFFGQKEPSLVPVPVSSKVTRKPVGKIEPGNLKHTTTDDALLENGNSTPVLVGPDEYESYADSTFKNGVQLVELYNGNCATNKYLDASDNADILMGLISMAVRSGEDVTYVDSFATDDVEASLLTKLGRPYEAAWNQVLILLAVIFVTLSVRFGLAPQTRVQQRGGRELVDGLAFMTRRKKSARWALRAVFDRTLAEMERRHRVSREQIIQRPDHYMEAGDAMKLKLIEAATLDDITEQDAVRQANELKRLV